MKTLLAFSAVAMLLSGCVGYGPDRGYGYQESYGYRDGYRYRDRDPADRYRQDRRFDERGRGWSTNGERGNQDPRFDDSGRGWKPDGSGYQR
ncbi:hypothetical protein [Comamonas terrae]|uniref:Lipoprotein n=1 Tax=Comamonas terrae TaxID=673548 RepID=A0ABW5URB0_9BURK|nr:hypothetical protein [Comamonas terrae]